MSDIRRIRVIDSHTGGEPTRVVLAGGPELGGGTPRERMETFRREYDHIRAAIVGEPRGSDVLVGVLRLEPADPAAAAGVIFFHSVGYLGMCGHGMIGFVRTLAHTGAIQPGRHVVETPVGPVAVTLHDDLDVSVRNVPAYRHARNVSVDVPEIGRIQGDIAWGGNWFYLVTEHGQRLDLSRAAELTMYTQQIRRALASAEVTGAGGAEIDHVELFAPSSKPGVDSKNFVLCPGGAYDRSPCGTGTSAKLACLFADGKLAEGAIWRQESITGSVFEGHVEADGDRLFPTIRGRAWITAESELILDSSDPFCWSISGNLNK